MIAKTATSPKQTRRLGGVPGRKSATKTFDADTLKGLAEDLKTGRLPLERVTVTDNIQTGLRAIVRGTGLISFHVQYAVGDERPYLKIGDFPEMTIEKARKIARTVINLGARGIDPTKGLHDRLINELDKQGDKWRG